MGMGFPFGSSSYKRACADYPSPSLAGTETKLRKPRPVPGDPQPARFEIVRTFASGSMVAAEIVWPDAKNYDGRKVAVYRTTLAKLVAATALDPHFAEKRGPLVPIARFEPTRAGWEMAVRFANLEGLRR